MVDNVLLKVCKKGCCALENTQRAILFPSFSTGKDAVIFSNNMVLYSLPHMSKFTVLFIAHPPRYNMKYSR